MVQVCSVEATEHLVRVFMCVPFRQKGYFHFAERPILDQEARQPENVFVLVLSPAIVQLQVQRRRQWTIDLADGIE